MYTCNEKNLQQWLYTIGYTCICDNAVALTPSPKRLSYTFFAAWKTRKLEKWMLKGICKEEGQSHATISIIPESPLGIPLVQHKHTLAMHNLNIKLADTVDYE